MCWVGRQAVVQHRRGWPEAQQQPVAQTACLGSVGLRGVQQQAEDRTNMRQHIGMHIVNKVRNPVRFCGLTSATGGGNKRQVQRGWPAAQGVSKGDSCAAGNFAGAATVSKVPLCTNRWLPCSFGGCKKKKNGRQTAGSAPGEASTWRGRTILSSISLPAR